MQCGKYAFISDLEILECRIATGASKIFSCGSRRVSMNAPELLVELQSTYPKLVRESVALLEASDLLGFTRVSAIRRSCGAINRLLIEMEELKQRHSIIEAKAASA